MDTLLIYIKNIGFFLILVSVICNALPDNSYKKYCKLFCGLVLVVLVLNPFNEFLNYEGNIGDIFTNKSYQSKLTELEAGMKMMEEEQMELALKHYENELKDELKATASNEGLVILDVDISYAEQDDEFKLNWIHLYVTDKENVNKKDENTENVNKEIVNKETENKEPPNFSDLSDINVDEIHIDEIKIDSNEGGDIGQSIDKLSPVDRPKVLKLIEKVAGLLGIETYMIKVTMK